MPTPPMVDVTTLKMAKRFLGGREICVIFLCERANIYQQYSIILCCEAGSICCLVKASGRIFNDNDDSSKEELMVSQQR